MDRTVAVLIADGKHLVSEGVRAELESHPDLRVVGMSTDARRAVDDVNRLRPDVAILDANLANGDGIDAARTIREGTGTAVIVLADVADDELLLESVVAGATGFVSRESPIEALVDATRALARGEAAIPPQMLPALLSNLIRRRRAQGVAVRAVSTLTRREKEILLMLAEGASNERMAERLVISPQTVRTHVQNLLRKLDLHSRVEAAAFVHANRIDEELEVLQP